ncbi:MAG: Crp/Fnr family transcriptional regulator [Saprospiraceae bacterium]|nr:Crp/Fnr family transcriptional regulator [Saprospiraceae bacterium]
MASYGLDKDLLIQNGGTIKLHPKGDCLFKESSTPRYYYQILSGCVKMISQNEDGKIYTHGLFSEGQSFGEPPLFLNVNYPSSAIAVTESVVIKVPRGPFFKLVEDNPIFYKNFVLILAERVYEKTWSNKMLTGQQPEFRILNFLQNFKKKTNIDLDKKILITLTRQEIADFTGLRVETVIRTLKKMEGDNKIEIRNRKLFY